MNEDEAAELAQLAAIKRRLDRSTFEVVERGVTYGGWVVKVVYVLIAVTVAVTGFVIRSQFRDADHDRRLDELEKMRDVRAEQIERLKDYDAQNTRIIDAIQKDVKDWCEFRPDGREMVFMRDNGISNKERYARMHPGFRVPGEATSETLPSQKQTPP